MKLHTDSDARHARLRCKGLARADAPSARPSRGLTIWALVVCMTLGACASPVDRANQLVRAGKFDEATALLKQASADNPQDTAARLQLMRQQGLRVQQWLLQAESARSAGRLDDARRLLQAVADVQPEHPRLATLRNDVERAQARQQRVEQARQDVALNRLAEAEAAVRQVLAEEPGHPAASALGQRIGDLLSAAQQPAGLDAALRAPVSLELRDAPLRSVFESLSRSSGISFVFDRDVRTEGRVTLLLRDTTLDEALRIVLLTQGLQRRMLNGSTVLVYPNTAAKQREHEELSTRAFYLVNSDVKQVQQLVRMMAKSRDIHIDERLNLMLVRDTPAVLQLIEKLVATVDLPDPEVTLEVQVLEVATDRLDSIGLRWPGSASFGLPGSDGGGGLNPPALALLGAQNAFRGWIANPAIVATLLGNSGGATLISNPSIRVRNREKARVQVGDRLPVFTTTSTANVGVSSSVSYLDVGLKLDIEPNVLLGNEVSMKVTLEVSNVVREVAGPQGALAYQIGTRMANTVLRLKDGETQVLAGLISDEDRKRASGLPGLSTLPVLGALFGTQTDTRNKTEVVLLITPRVVRNLPLPPYAGLFFSAGVDADPGLPALRLGARAQAAAGEAGVAPAAPAGAAPTSGAAGTGAGSARGAGPAADGALQISATAQAAVGDTVSIALKNESNLRAVGELAFDANFLQPASGGVAADGRVSFDLPPQGEKVIVLRVLPAAAGAVMSVNLNSVAGVRADGTRVLLPTSGTPIIEIAAL